MELNEAISYLGYGLLIVGLAWLLYLIFKDSVGRGVISLWLYPLVYFFVFDNWKISRIPVSIHLAGIALVVFANYNDPTFDRTNNIVYSPEMSVSVKIHEDWGRIEIEEGAIIEAGNLAKQEYFEVIEVKKNELSAGIDLEKYFSLFRQDFSKLFESVENKKFRKIKINGNNAIQGITFGTDPSNNFRIGYIVTIVESKDSFFIVMAWTFSNMLEERQNKLDSVIQSFKIL